MIQFRGISYLPVGVVLASSLLVASGITLFQTYQSNTLPTTEVLGASTVQTGRCTDNDILENELQKLDRTITLYAPDKTVTLGVGQLAKCFTVDNCSEDVSTCGNTTLTIKPSCVAQYFDTFNTGLTESYTVAGNNFSTLVRKEDWSVNTNELAQQIAAAVEKEVSYCQVIGQVKSQKASVGNIQVAVTNDLPSVPATFAQHFIEVDKSRQQLYFWNDGIYQVYAISAITKVPKEGIYLASDVSFADWVSSLDKAYLQRNVSKTFPVVVHQ